LIDEVAVGSRRIAADRGGEEGVVEGSTEAHIMARDPRGDA